MERTLDLMKELLTAYFVDKNANSILEICSDKIYICGLANNLIIRGKKQLKDKLEDISTKLEEKQLRIGKGEIIDEHMAMLSFSLVEHGVDLPCRVFGVSTIINGVECLSVLNYSIVNPVQKSGMCYDIAQNIQFQSSMLNNTNGAIVLYRMEQNYDFVLLYASDGIERVSGRSREEYERLCDEDLLLGVFEADRGEVKCAIEKAISSEESTSLLFRFQDSRNNYKWINGQFSKYGEDAGKPILRAVYHLASPKYELQLQALSTEYVGICIFDTQTGEVYYANDAAFDMCGKEKCEVAGKTYKDLFWNETDNKSWVQDVRKREKGEREVHAKDGRVLQVSNEERIWAGKEINLVVARDISEKFYLNEKLIQSQAAAEDACYFAGVWMWIYDYENDCITTSKNLQKDYGMPEKLDNFPDSWFDMGFIAPEYIELHREKVLAIKNGSKKEEFECKVIHEDGSVHWSRISFNRLDDTPGFAVGTSQLIDEEKILQARLQMERQKKLNSDKSLIGYIVTNVSENKVLERDSKHDNMHLTQVGLTMEAAMELVKDDIAPEDRVRYTDMHNRDKLMQMFQNGITTMDFVGHRVNVDGEHLWTKSVFNLLMEPVSGDIYLYEYVYNIHGQKMMEEIMDAAARYEYKRIASINMKADQMTIIHGEDHKVTIWNYTEKGIQYGNTAILEEDRALYLQNTALTTIKKELEKKDWFEFVCRTKEVDGSIRYQRIRYAYYNREMEICLMTRADITEVMLKEEHDKKALSDSLNQVQKVLAVKEKLEKDKKLLYAALFDMVPMVISSNLTTNQYTVLNYENYTTKKAKPCGIYDELVEVGVSTIPDDQKQIFKETFNRENVIKAYHEGKKSVQLEHQQWGDDGVLRWIDTNCIFVPNEIDESLCTITLAQDITERKHKNLELQKALNAAQEATRAKSEFLSRMSHEIRTPMNAIIGMTAIAQENKSDFMQVSDCLSKIDLSSHYLLTLLNDILEMSRIESGTTSIKTGEFDFDVLMEGIQTIVEVIAVQHEIRYECVNHANLDYHYIGDRLRIQQIIVNIITNAIKFTKKGGRVRFSVTCEEAANDRMNFCFTVEDTGIGMSEEFMKRMFKPFTQEDGSNTSRYQGSGLGLAISRNLIELMGGTITADSFVGVGTTFRIMLPLKRVKKGYSYSNEKKRDTSLKDITMLKGCKILVAEDHPMNVMIAKRLLEDKGMVVNIADNGKMAIDMFNASDINYYCAILMDIRMPVIDGIEATRQIRRLRREDASTIPIIAMTANALDEDRKMTREAGMDAHLAKPFDPKQLFKTLMEWIHK